MAIGGVGSLLHLVSTPITLITDSAISISLVSGIVSTVQFQEIQRLRCAAGERSSWPVFVA